MNTNIKEKIKNYIKSWLFQDELKKINAIYDDQKYLLDQVREARDSFRAAYNTSVDARDMVAQCLDMGVDIHLKDYSWAVVCIKGKPEYIRFMKFDHHTALQMRDYLRAFRSSNVVWDLPYSYNCDLFWKE